MSTQYIHNLNHLFLFIEDKEGKVIHKIYQPLNFIQSWSTIQIKNHDGNLLLKWLFYFIIFKNIKIKKTPNNLVIIPYRRGSSSFRKTALELLCSYGILSLDCPSLTIQMVTSCDHSAL